MNSSKTSSLRAAEAGVRDLSDQVMQSAEQAVQSSRDFAHDSMDKAHEAFSAKLRDLQRYANVGADYVAQQPVKSVLIAAATGAAVAAVIMALRSRHH